MQINLAILSRVLIFTARHYASAYMLLVCPGICLSVRVSVISRYCIEKSKGLDISSHRSGMVLQWLSIL